jgi:CelD/BcsL family acetyltransferase involved in cellulose biosynthesis
VVDLSGGWAPWLVDKKKSTSRVKRTLEKERKLSREVGPITLVYDSREHLDLCQLMAWKSFQYTHTGRFDLFSQNWMRNFLHELLDTRVHNFSMRLSRLQAGSRTVALYLCTRSDTVLGSWFPTYDPRLASYSPGFISVLSLLEAAAGDGIRKVDLGKGHEGYKQTLKNGDDMIGQGVVTRFAPFTLWRDVYQAPRRFAFRLVNRSPRAYRAADATLRRAARARARLGRS